MNITRKDRCYYDGMCGLCGRTVRTLRRLDWLQRLEFIDMFSVNEIELPVPLEEAMTGMPMRTASGRVLVGFEAMRRAMRRTPLGLLPALALYVPPLNAIGAGVYRAVAARRRRRGACAVPPSDA